jgi:hypothetical protein
MRSRSESNDDNEVTSIHFGASAHAPTETVPTERASNGMQSSAGLSTPPMTPAAAQAPTQPDSGAAAKSPTTSEARTPNKTVGKSPKSKGSSSSNWFVRALRWWTAPPSDLDLESLEELRMITGCESCHFIMVFVILACSFNTILPTLASHIRTHSLKAGVAHTAAALPAACVRA